MNDLSFRFACPRCGQHLTGTLEQTGMMAPCPGCGETIAVPRPPAAVLPPPLPTARSATAQKSEQKIGNQWTIPGIVLAVGVIIVGRFMGGELGKHAGAAAARRENEREAAASAPATGRSNVVDSSRRRQEAGGVSLETPSDIVSGSNAIRPLSAAAQARVERYETFVSVNVNPRVTVTRARFRPDVVTNIDAAAGGVGEGVMVLASEKPAVVPQKTLIDGLPARRASGSFRIGDFRMHYAFVVVLEGQNYWEVVVIETTPLSATPALDGNRILDSIRITDR